MWEDNVLGQGSPYHREIPRASSPQWGEGWRQQVCVTLFPLFPQVLSGLRLIIYIVY